MKRVLVIGATGNIGREVVGQLNAQQVRAFVRDPKSARLPAGVELAHGDLTEPATIERAARDVDAAFLVWTAPAEAADAAIERLVRSIRRIVLLSSPHQTPHPFFQQPNPMATFHEQLDRAVSQAREWTIIRPHMFASNCIAWWGPQIRTGDAVRWPYGDAASAPVDEHDVAAVAVEALLHDHNRRDYVVTGPQSLTHREQVKIIGDVLGRRLRFEEMSREEAAAAIPDMLLNAWQAAIGLPAYVTDTVREVTGRNARTFREWAEDHKSDFLK